jgi:hypothetical protein
MSAIKRVRTTFTPSESGAEGFSQKQAEWRAQYEVPDNGNHDERDHLVHLQLGQHATPDACEIGDDRPMMVL